MDLRDSSAEKKHVAVVDSVVNGLLVVASLVSCSVFDAP